MLAYDWNFLGLSTETKPTAGEKVVDGSTFYECDTSTFYVFYNGNWYLQTFITEDGINFWLYKALMKKMFGKLFDSNITLAKIIKPTTGTEIEFTSTFPAQITDLTGYGNTSQQASPTPTTPQTVNVVTGAQTVKIHGKNYIDNSNLSYDFTNVSPTTQIELTSTSTGMQMNYTGGGTAPAVSFKLLDLTGYEGKTIRMSSTFTGQRIAIQNVNADLSERDYAVYTTTSGETISWTVPNDLSTLGDKHYLAYYLRGSQGITTYNNLILTIDDSDMTFMPYQGQSYTVDLGSIELCKIGTYQDYIYKSGDDWYVHKETTKEIFDGTENWNYGPISTFYRASHTYSGWMSSQQYFYNSHFTAGNTGNTPNVCGIGGTQVFMSMDASLGVTTKAEWLAWLSNNNVTMYVILATPTDTKITDSTLIGELNALLNYTFPGGENHLVITADDLPMSLKLTITEKE